MRGVARHSSGGFCNFVRAGAATNPDCEGSRPSAFSRSLPRGGADTVARYRRTVKRTRCTGFSALLIRRGHADSSIASIRRISCARDIRPTMETSKSTIARLPAPARRTRGRRTTRGERMQHCRTKSVRPSFPLLLLFLLLFRYRRLNLSGRPRNFRPTRKSPDCQQSGLTAGAGTRRDSPVVPAVLEFLARSTLRDEIGRKFAHEMSDLPKCPSRHVFAPSSPFLPPRE